MPNNDKSQGVSSQGVAYQNVKLGFSSKLSEIRYSSISNVIANPFLQKYFKYQCELCDRLSSHSLVSPCCNKAICFECATNIHSYLTQSICQLVGCPLC